LLAARTLLSLGNRPSGSGTSTTCGADRYRCARLGERSFVRDAEWYRDSMSFHNANTRLGVCLLGNGSAAYASNDYDFTADTIYKIGPNGASNFITSHDIGLEAGPAPGGSLRLLREGVNAAFEFPTAPASGPGIGGIFGECRARLASYAQVALVVLRKIPQVIGAGIFPHLLR